MRRRQAGSVERAPSRLVRLAVVAAAIGIAAIAVTLATTPTSGVTGRGAADAYFDRLGGTWRGTPSSPEGRCEAYPFEIRVDRRTVGCTHGPDPMPDAVRAGGRVTLAELRTRTAEFAAVAGGAPTDVPCIGLGTSGLRVDAIYAYEEGTTSRYDEIAPMIRAWAGEIDSIVDVSAGQTGGSRHVRWHHDASCNVVVAEVELSAGAVYGGPFDPFSMMIGELEGAGFDRFDRRYLVWVDASSFDTGICGIAMTGEDESAGPENIHNGVPSAGLGLFGRVDRDCWGLPAPENLIEAHELTHTLGAVQPNAPFSSSVVSGDQVTFYGHCIDEYDTMCYQDGTPKSLIFPCPVSQERLLDCRHDTYFSTNPPAGSYLATNWNTAMNAFLVRNDPIAGFIDVGTAFRGDIEWLAQQGITGGCSADLERFCADAVVTRAQMASFLARALELPPASTDPFTDDEGSVHEADINRVAAAGITVGCAPSRFCPTRPVTRAQMASFLVRALVLPPTSTDRFTDDEGSPHEGDINRLAASGITAGCTGTTFCPSLSVSRGQMAAFLHRGLE